jgi:amino acid adenylation domain-containing protein
MRTDPSRAPLMPVVFNLGRVSRQLRVPGADFAFAQKGFGFFDVNIDAHDTGREIHLACRYNAALFEDASVGRMLDHFRTLLASAAKDTGQRIADLPMFTETERRQVLVDWNRTAADFPRDRCAHELIEEQTKRTPAAVAVKFGPERLTYAELNARANRLARHLRQQGVGPDTLVGLCLERSLDLIVGLLGILKAGGAYVPLDPNYPADRLAFLIEDSETNLILTRQSLRSRLGNGPARLLCLDTAADAIARESADDVVLIATPENLAYVIYTSGSTGRPKGVLLEHRGLCNLVAAQIRELQIGPESRVLQFSSISFDASVSEIFTALTGGATLCLAEFEKLLPGPELLALLRGEEISVATLTPSVLHAISEADLPALKTVVSAGEACTPELAARWGRGRRLINGYGPTEATVCASMKVIDPADTTLTIGRPIANAEFYILDGQRQPVPVGVAGELHIGGIGLARGYHNRAELTAEKFIAHPFSTEPGARLYKTGDRARFLPSGDVEYLGRLDHQVKIRGFRVELGEIEQALDQHPGVEASVVIAREDTPGDKRLVAYLTSRHGIIPPADVRESLRARLPEFMVPSAFVTLPSLPLSPSGKVDRKALPRPDFEAGADRGNFAAPGTPTEIALAEIWCAVLGLKQVGIHDNFFDLGGHSLLAVRITNQINQALHSHLAIPELFQNPTIAKLAAILDQEKRDRGEAGPRSDDRTASPLITFQAKGSRPPLFFMHGDWTGGGFYCGRLSQQLGEDQPFYVVPPLRLDRKTTIEDMAAAHIATIQEHTPHGPYLLGGYCVGAVVTMEIARQLTEKGEQVLPLFLIDPTPLSSPWLRWAWLAITTVGEFREWDLRKKIACFDRSAVTFNRWLVKPLRSKLVAVGNRLGLRGRMDSGTTSTAPDEGGGEEAALLNSLDYEVYMLAFRLCRPKPIPVPAIFYMPVETHPGRLARVYRLRRLFPAVTVEMVPGDHRTCIIGHASAIGQKMRQALGLT